MSEATLQRLLERLNGDASFRERAQADPESVWAEFALSPTEQVALSSGDEDALRRLAGADVSGFWGVTYFFACPPNTPGSGNDCGTGTGTGTGAGSAAHV